MNLTQKEIQETLEKTKKSLDIVRRKMEKETDLDKRKQLHNRVWEHYEWFNLHVSKALNSGFSVPEDDLIRSKAFLYAMYFSDDYESRLRNPDENLSAIWDSILRLEELLKQAA